MGYEALVDELEKDVESSYDDHHVGQQ